MCIQKHHFSVFIKKCKKYYSVFNLYCIILDTSLDICFQIRFNNFHETIVSFSTPAHQHTSKGIQYTVSECELFEVIGTRQVPTDRITNERKKDGRNR